MARIRKSEKMMQTAVSNPVIWHIAVYIRLSREDGNDESLSITNQKKIILEYLENLFDGEYDINDYYIDDGLTGTDYDRPGFQRMIHDMDIGKINCIVCKNLSRMFRNYSDQGYFLEKVFPTQKTRFLTVCEPCVDSYLHPEIIQGLEVPINGLMNDRYAAKTSSDVRNTFATKRRRGEFIGAFAPYGYAKDPENKNMLVIDEVSAEVVRDIFHWFAVEGMSKNGIAKRLNSSGIPNPTAYKQRTGLKYNHPQSHKNDGLWCGSGIAAVLKNSMYLGTMVQGKQKVISYKVHKKVSISENEWIMVEGTHEPIIDRHTFEKAKRLQERDTRTAPDKRNLHLFSGLIRCADCKKSMTRQKSKNIVYYYCRTFRDKSGCACTKHTIKEETLKQVILITLQKQIELVETLAETIDIIDKAASVQNQSVRFSSMLKLRKNELNKVINLIDGLYGDWKSGEISYDEYRRLKSKYESQAEQLKAVIQTIRLECAMVSDEITMETSYLAAFLKYKNLNTLERGILVELVNNIFIHKGGEIEIEFNFADQQLKLMEFIDKLGESECL